MECVLMVTKDKFAFRLPLNHRISITTIKYTTVGDYIILEGTMGGSPAPVVQVVDERKEKKPLVDLEKPPDMEKAVKHFHYLA
jgi:hypothetical protein